MTTEKEFYDWADANLPHDVTEQLGLTVYDIVVDLAISNSCDGGMDWGLAVNTAKMVMDAPADFDLGGWVG